MFKGTSEKFIIGKIKLLDKIRQPNIITIMAVCSTVTQVHLVMEYFDSCSLHDILFRPEIKKEYPLNTQNKNKIAYLLCCALSFLHLKTSPIIHRGVKPENVLVGNRFHTLKKQYR